MVVSALIFVLGIDLVKEALWDTRHRVSKTEYFTIASIMVAMTAWDFVIGVLFGIVVSCEFVPLCVLYMDSVDLGCRRPFLRRTKFTAPQHPRHALRRSDSLDSASPKRASRIPSRGLATDDHHAPPRLPLLWHYHTR